MATSGKLVLARVLLLLLLLGLNSLVYSGKLPQKRPTKEQGNAATEPPQERSNEVHEETQQATLPPNKPKHGDSVAKKVADHAAGKLERDPKDYLKLSTHPDCSEDVEKLCHEVNKDSNFLVLVCLQDKAKEDDLSDTCHQHLWEYKQNLTKDVRFEDAAASLCVKTLEEHQHCAALKGSKAGEMVPCLLEVRHNVTENKCKNFLTKMQAVYFSDYRLIKGFVDACQKDVQKYKCGRIEQKDEEDVHNQNEVLECLEEHQENLDEKCQLQIVRIAELSADDYHLDRPLYYACREDREHFCAEIPAGDGKVYNCLTENKFDARMSQQCKHQLTLRQKLEQQDPKVDFPLMKSCEADIDRLQCDGKGKTPHGKMAHLMLCLEKAISNGETIDGKCQEEMFKLRQQLMEDHSINPEIVRDCELEIKVCHGDEEETKPGKTIDCLMKMAEEGHEKMGKKCQKAISVLLRETQAGNDYRMDHTLYTACQPVVQTACKGKGKKDGDVMVLSCLMEQLHTENMPKECERQLMHLQFFIARDFALDTDLYQACHKDAETVCHAKAWDDTKDELPSGMIVSCLYRNSFRHSKKQVSRECAVHVRRVMHQRAADVKLLPHVQEACLHDLGKHCSNDVEAGKEIECLQTNYENLEENCREAIGNFTEEEAEDIDLDKTLVTACSGMVNKFCKDVVERGDSEEVMPCLIEHKYNMEMNEKCRASIEHWQLTEMKDFRFSPKFKEKCREDVRTLCKDQIKTKFDVVKCLSKAVRDAVVKSTEHKVSEECRKQLRVEKMEIGENIKFDPDLYSVCTKDAERLCQHVKAGQAMVLECLKDNRKRLSKECHEELFQREEEEMKDPELDYHLIKTCDRMIMKFCDNVEPDEILNCLKKNKDAPEMDSKCRQAITKRQIIQAEDPGKLDVQMIESCKLDIPKFCGGVKDPKHGSLMKCLKNNIQKLSEDCEEYVRSTMHEAAKDYRLDPALADACETEIDRLCKHVRPGHGKVENCLKKKFREGEIKSTTCKQEVSRTLDEGRTDIFADPILADACSLDIRRHCVDVPPGLGRIITCLKEVRQTGRGHKLSKECNAELRNRMAMWAISKSEQKLNSLAAIANAVNMSPSRNYFFIVFATCLALIFVGGLVFGRLSKRVRQEYKDR